MSYVNQNKSPNSTLELKLETQTRNKSPNSTLEPQLKTPASSSCLVVALMRPFRAQGQGLASRRRQRNGRRIHETRVRAQCLYR